MVTMERRTLLLAAAAIPLGLGIGYAWSVVAAPKPHAAAARKPAFGDIAPSPEELPTVEDKDWTDRSNDAQAASGDAAPPANVTQP